LKVSAISLGGWINFEAKLPEDEAKGIVKTAYEGGVNFYDVADVYGQGEAERWMGGLLSEYPRYTLVISTKVYGRMSDAPNDRGLSRKHIMESIDKSLARLGTDYVDIYFCHRADSETPILETARAMNDLIRAGKVLYWGTSMWEPEQMQEAYDLCEKYNLIAPQVDQPVYNMLLRDHVEEKIGPLAETLGFGLTVYSPLAMGMLTGKYDDTFPEDSRFIKEDWATKEYYSEENAERVRQLRPVAHALGLTRSQLALAWALRNRAVSSVITGATKVTQIEDNLQAASVPIPDDAAARIEEILA
jgi:voltage-dependent potassium channel beta subunit